MKKKTRYSWVIAIFICLIMVGVFAGCETAKGMGRDVKSADQWMRDHLW